MKPLRCNSLCVNYKGPSYIIDNTFEFAYNSFASFYIKVGNSKVENEYLDYSSIDLFSRRVIEQ